MTDSKRISDEQYIRMLENEIHQVKKSRDNYQGYAILISIVAVILFGMLVSTNR